LVAPVLQDCRRCFLRRQQSLRYTDTNADTDTNTDTNTDANADGDANSDADPNDSPDADPFGCSRTGVGVGRFPWCFWVDDHRAFVGDCVALVTVVNGIAYVNLSAVLGAVWIVSASMFPLFLGMRVIQRVIANLL